MSKKRKRQTKTKVSAALATPCDKTDAVTFEIGFVDDLHINYPVNGQIKRRIALRVDGEEKDVVALALDSDPSRVKQAKRWAKAFGLCQETVESKLRIVALRACEENQKRIGEQNKRIQAAVSEAISGGQESPPPHIALTLDEARLVFRKWLADLDGDLLDVTFGTIMAHQLDGDPVWLFVVGPPGDGKTEVLRSTSQHPTVYMLSSLKPASLISGFQNDNGPEPSLLPKLNGKVLLVKDFTTVLELPTDARAEIISTLRDAYDGEASKAFGTGEVKKFRSRFGILAAVTPYVERCWGVNQQLGERFLKFRLRGHKRTAKVRRAIGNANGETAMRVSLSEAALGVLAQDNGIPTMPEHIERQLVHLADFVSRVRSEVSRDRRGVVEFVPQPEIGTRVGKQLKKLAIGIAMARGVRAVDDDVYRIIRRVGMDSVPSIRMKLLRVLWAFRDDFRATSNIGDEAEVPTDTAKTWLEDLRLLGIVERHGKGKFLWRLLADFVGTVTACRVFDANDVDCVYTPPSDSYPPQTDDGAADFEEGKNHPPTYAQDRREPENPLLDTENDDSVGSEHSDQEPDNSDEAERQAIQETEAEEERRAAGVPDGWSAETCRLACAAEAVGAPGTT